MRMLPFAVSVSMFVQVGTAIAAEWKPISAEQSRIFASSVSGLEYAETGWNESYSRRAYRAVKTDRKPSDDRLELYYYELAPGRFFPKLPSAKEQMSNFNYLKSGFSDVGDERHFRKRHRVSYVTLRKAARECLAFVATAGGGGGDGQTSAGTSYMAGYYCNAVGAQFDEAGIDRFLGTIGTKDVGLPVPAPPPASLNSTQPVTSAVRSQVDASPTPTAGGVEARLREAKRLFDDKLISEDEYAAMRRKIIGLE